MPIVTIGELGISAINVTVDELLELTCKVDSFPPALVHWEENGVIVTGISQVAELSVAVNSTVLGGIIEYTCLAENVVGGKNRSVRNSVIVSITGER